MGASGAGKTSLLNILSSRISNTKKVSVSGDVLANDLPYGSNEFAQFAGYVMQSDILQETMTPRGKESSLILRIAYIHCQSKNESR